MRRSIMILMVSVALPLVVACERDAPRAPAATSEARVEPGEPAVAPSPEPAPTEASAPAAPGVSIGVTLGGFNARAFSNFAACSGATLSIAGDRARCRSNCECMGVHDGPDSQEHCLLSCSAD